MIKLENLLLPGANIVFFAFNFLADTQAYNSITIPTSLIPIFFHFKA